MAPPLRYDGYPAQRRSIAPWAMLATVAIGGAYVLNHKFDWLDLPKIPAISEFLSTDPETAVASTDQNSYNTEVRFDISCSERVSVAVDVEAFKNGPIGDGVVEKKIFGDFLLCSDDSEVTSRARALEDPVTGQVTSLTVQLSGVYVEQPRVHHLDVRNCIDGNIGDSMQEIQDKLDQRAEDISNGKEPSCDNGFRVTQIGGSSDLSKAIDISLKAAQLGIAVDANPVDIIEQANERLEADVKAQLEAQSEFSNAKVEVTVIPPSDTETVQQKINRIIDDLSDMFEDVRVGSNDRGDYLYVEDASGAHATVYFTGYAALDVDQLEIDNVEVLSRADQSLPPSKGKDD